MYWASNLRPVVYVGHDDIHHQIGSGLFFCPQGPCVLQGTPSHLAAADAGLMSCCSNSYGVHKFA